MATPKHTGRFVITHNPTTVWVATCGRHFTATGATYETAEDEWRKHVHAVTGKAPRPLGDKTVERWMP